jgi:hypothetical protein
MIQLQDFGRFLDFLVYGLLVGFRQLQTERQILTNRHMRIQSVTLEYHRHAAFGRCFLVHTLAADGQLAAGNVFQTGNHAQQGRFTATGRADEYAKLAFFDV